MKQVTIIGGGIIGLCTAWYLRRQGYPVTIIDRGDITSGTSFGNMGYISPSHFSPLASPGIVAQGLRWMLSSSSPFYIKPRASWDLVRWGWHFWRKANAATMQKNTLPLNELLQLSRRLASEMLAETGNHYQMEEKGCLMLYKSAKTEKHEAELAQEAGRLGISTQILTAAEVQALEPELELNVLGGVLYPGDCHLNPGDLMRTLHEQLDINWHLCEEVKGFESANGRVNAVITDKGRVELAELVLAGGSWTPELSRMLGLNLLMQAGKGYSLTFDGLEKNLHYPAILVDDRTAMTPWSRSLRMGGTMEISGLNSPLLIKRAEAIFKAAKNYYPGLPVQFPSKEKIWWGLRPLSPDGLPYIGRHSAFSNLIIATGHAMLGVSLAHATGQLVTELVAGQARSMEIEAFDVERYG